MSRTGTTSARPEALLLNARQAAAALGISESSLRNYVRRGAISPVRIAGSPPRFRRADIDRLAERGTQ
jgi:excisionase family DNA binding protein